MKTHYLNSFIQTSSLVGLTLAGCLAQASTDYGPAVWRPVCDGKWYTTGSGHKFYVIHDMEGYYLTSISYMQRCDVSVSVHYAVNGLKDNSSDAAPGEVSQLVRDTYYAWHARCWNQHSMGTEHEGFASNPAWYTEAMYVASASLTASKATKYSFAKDRNHIVGHNEDSNSAWVAWADTGLGIDPTCNTHHDPGAYWDWTHYMALVLGGNIKAPAMFYDTGGSMNTYRWRSSGSGFTFYSQQSQSGFNLANVGQHIVSADVNGDSIKDIVAAHQNTDGTMSLHVFLSGATPSTVWYTGGQFNMANVNGRMVAGDFTGDGKEDIAMLYETSASGMTIFRFISTGSAFTTQTHVYPNGYSLTNVQDNVTASDVNGNGKADIIAAYQYPDNTMRLHVFLDGIGNVTASTWFTSGGSFLISKIGGRLVGGNFDGGAHGDVAALYEVTPGGGTMNIYRFLSNGSSFSCLTEPYPQGYFLVNVGKNVAAADVTGDGKADIVTAYQYGDGTMHLHMFLNGTGTLTAQDWYQSGPFSLGNVAGRFVLGNW